MNNLHVLIVEDESLIAHSLCNAITAFGYSVVDYATNSKMAKEIMAQEYVNLIMMDINLKEPIDGIDLYKSLEGDIPVIYLTAYKDDTTINKAIATEPLGFLIKPYNENELKALLKLAHLKLQNSSTNHVIELGHKYQFNIKEEKLCYGGEFINLGSKELQLLKLLIKADGKVVSFKTIEDEIWSAASATDSSMRTLIYRLKNKLYPDAIENEFNHGIRLKKA